MALGRHKHRQTQLVHMGKSLVQEFVQAVNNEVLVLSLKNEAMHNEQRALGGVTAFSGAGNTYEPDNIPIEQQLDIARTSMNAHMQKAQAMQAEAYNSEQLHEASKMLRERYEGHRVIVRVVSKGEKPVQSYWRDMMTGKLSATLRSPKKLSGTIEFINLAGNFIIVRPGVLAKAVNHNLEYHRVYIINPATLEPMVSLSIA